MIEVHLESKMNFISSAYSIYILITNVTKLQNYYNVNTNKHFITSQITKRKHD